MGVVVDWYLQVKIREDAVERYEQILQQLADLPRVRRELRHDLKTIEEFMAVLDSENSVLLRQIGEGPDSPSKTIQRNRWSE